MAELINHPHAHKIFTGEVDKENGTMTPTPELREQFPPGLEGRWLVDRFYPDNLYAEFNA